MEDRSRVRGGGTRHISTIWVWQLGFDPGWSMQVSNYGVERVRDFRRDIKMEPLTASSVEVALSAAVDRALDLMGPQCPQEHQAAAYRTAYSVQYTEAGMFPACYHKGGSSNPVASYGNANLRMHQRIAVGGGIRKYSTPYGTVPFFAR